MERNVAIKRLSKMLGKGFAYEIKNNAPTPEERAAAIERAPILNAAREAASKALDARRTELLQGDSEYQRLKAELRTAQKLAQENSAPIYTYKITVGYANSLWFSVKAQGDSWEDIFAKLAKEKSRA